MVLTQEEFIGVMSSSLQNNSSLIALTQVQEGCFLLFPFEISLWRVNGLVLQLGFSSNLAALCHIYSFS